MRESSILQRVSEIAASIQTGHGVIGDTKYNRRKTKRELRKLIDES